MENAKNFDTALAAFLAHCNQVCAEYYKTNFPNLEPPVVDVGGGEKYLRIVRYDRGDRTRGSAHAFVEVSTGNVLYPASWKAPAKGKARGNIYTIDNYGVDAYGAKRLR